MADETINGQGILRSLSSLAVFLRTFGPRKIKNVSVQGDISIVMRMRSARYRTFSGAAARRKAPCMKGSPDIRLLEWERLASLHALIAHITISGGQSEISPSYTGPSISTFMEVTCDLLFVTSTTETNTNSVADFRNPHDEATKAASSAESPRYC